MGELTAQTEDECDMSCRNRLVANDATTVGSVSTNELADLFTFRARLEDEEAVPAKGSDLSQVDLLRFWVARKISDALADLPCVVPEFAARCEQGSKYKSRETSVRFHW